MLKLTKQRTFRGARPTKAEQGYARGLCEAHGVLGAASRLGLSRLALLGVAAGISTTAGTVQVVRDHMLLHGGPS